MPMPQELRLILLLILIASILATKSQFFALNMFFSNNDTAVYSFFNLFAERFQQYPQTPPATMAATPPPTVRALSESEVLLPLATNRATPPAVKIEAPTHPMILLFLILLFISCALKYLLLL